MRVLLSNGVTVEKMDLATIRLCDQQPPTISRVLAEDGFAFDPAFKHDRRLRVEVYEMLKSAQKKLPAGLRLLIGEAYRPIARQIRMWNDVVAKVDREYPSLSEDEKILVCENFIANPYDGIGSGHQAACAVDVTLCDDKSGQLDMGTALQELNERTRTASSEITENASNNRRLLLDAMESVGFANYPAEWWHYSYGDHQWAWLVGRSEAMFGMLDLPDESSSKKDVS